MHAYLYIESLENVSHWKYSNALKEDFINFNLRKYGKKMSYFSVLYVWLVLTHRVKKRYRKLHFADYLARQYRHEREQITIIPVSWIMRALCRDAWIPSAFCFNAAEQWEFPQQRVVSVHTFHRIDAHSTIPLRMHPTIGQSIERISETHGQNAAQVAYRKANCS